MCDEWTRRGPHRRPGPDAAGWGWGRIPAQGRCACGAGRALRRGSRGPAKRRGPAPGEPATPASLPRRVCGIFKEREFFAQQSQCWSLKQLWPSGGVRWPCWSPPRTLGYSWHPWPGRQEGRGGRHSQSLPSFMRPPSSLLQTQRITGTGGQGVCVAGWRKK